MELCRPDTLRHWLRDRNANNDKDINRYQALVWFKDIISGVKYIHDSGMIHRDIKPDNILFTLGNTVKIADFGLATDCPYNTHTTGVGSWWYKSPEQHRSHYGKEADIFPLGNY